MVTWNNTKYPGVRYREHKTRKHGVQPDKYFAIRYMHDGKQKEEGLGWASQGWDAKRASEELSRLRHANRTGEGPQTLEEKRLKAEDERRQRAIEEKRHISFSVFFHSVYFHLPRPIRRKRLGKGKRLFSGFG